MSDGMSDGMALARIETDLRHAAAKLADEIVKAKRGHRGLRVNVFGIANTALERCGLTLVERR